MRAVRHKCQGGRDTNPKRSVFRPILGFLSACILLCALAGAAAVPTAAADNGARDSVRELIPGGMAFGVKYYAKGAIIIGVCDVETASGLTSPARDAGLAAGDIVTAAGGSEINTLEELLELVKGCGGKKIELQYLRDNQTQSTFVTPVIDKGANEYRIGVWVRDSTAGIGTITFIDAKNRRFGGLGHGINDSTTGMLMPFGRGSITPVRITGVVKGRKSVPGELKGEFDTKDVGKLLANTEVGVFGIYDTLPEPLPAPVPVAHASALRTGEAIVRTSASGTVQDYAIEIEEIYKDSGSTKNFLVRVTDERLLTLTGGIVQGMSGSPILQDGKLVGAVTHVLVNDPTRGYGICIDNMLSEMQRIG